LLDVAARDLLNGGDVEISVLLPPGSCPGHFDLSPATLPLVRSASLVVRHDYQEALDEKLRALGSEHLHIHVIVVHGSLLIPDNYIRMVRGLVPALVQAFPGEKACIDRNLAKVEQDTVKLRGEMAGQDYPWQGAAVIASAHQKDFAQWLGLTVIDVIKRPEELTPADYER